MEYLSDEFLMTQIQSGKIASCGLLYERYKNILYTYFYNNTKNHSSSEDLLQVTFEKLLKYQKNYKASGTFKAWIFSIARNALIDNYKKSKKLQTSALTEKMSLELEDEYDQNENIQEQKNILKMALNQLSPEKKEIFMMAKINGMKYKEICKMYNLTEANLKVKIFRIMREVKAIALNHKSW